MATTEYPRDSTALLFVDPYNDFSSEGGLLGSGQSKAGKGYQRLNRLSSDVAQQLED
jgi:hypothetical protein